MSDQQPFTPSVDEGRLVYMADGLRGLSVSASNEERRRYRDELRAEFDRMIEAVRAEEREKYSPEKDERLARYMALVTPLGYASALEVVNSLTAMVNAEARGDEIAEKARQEERERAAQIADEAARNWASTYRQFAADEIAARIRAQGEEQA
ncbi:hypothetical protein [Microbacterium sp. gxy059]|uniref:hypothetical protein n=1 Tax=Microbacterium sp. gxy059 TaxID=2957199 RepID=UPI003D99A2DC